MCVGLMVWVLSAGFRSSLCSTPGWGFYAVWQKLYFILTIPSLPRSINGIYYNVFSEVHLLMLVASGFCSCATVSLFGVSCLTFTRITSDIYTCA